MILVSMKKRMLLCCYKNDDVIKSHDEHKDVLWNKKCLRHSINRIQRKDHRIGTYEINKIYLSSLDDKIIILKNGFNYKNTVVLIIYSKQHLWEVMKILLLFFSSQNRFFVKL